VDHDTCDKMYCTCDIGLWAAGTGTQ